MIKILKIDTSLPISKGINETLCLETWSPRKVNHYKLHAVLSFAQNPQSTQKGKKVIRTVNKTKS